MGKDDRLERPPVPGNGGVLLDAFGRPVPDRSERLAPDRSERPPVPDNSGRRAFLVLVVVFVVGVCILMMEGRSNGPLPALVTLTETLAEAWGSYGPRPAAATLPTDTRSMSFAACQQALRQTIQTTGVRPWDVVRIIDTDGYSVTRVCTSDGSILITCNGPDRKMAVTKSPYRDGCPV